MLKKLLVGGVMLALVLTVVGGASTVSAQSADMCATIDALAVAGIISADKVASTKAMMGCGVAAPASCTATFTRSLSEGSTGADVTALQTKLGVTPVTGYYGKLTVAAVSAYQVANGIANPGTGNVGPLTLAKLNYCAPVTTTTTTTTTTVTPASTLEGGAGDLSFTTTSTGLENNLKEGDSNVKVLAFKAEADGSDIEVTSLKVTLQNDGYASSSEKITNYIDEVTVWMGSTKVGSIDASDLTRDSGSPDLYSKTIALSNAVVKDGVKATFYVAVSAVSSIDSADMTDASLTVDVTTVRFTDATGAIMSEDLTGDHDVSGIDFSDVSTDDEIAIKTSSANPVASPITVDDNSVSDEALVGAFKLDVGDDSSDIMISEIPVVLTINDSDDTATSDDAEDIIDSVMVKIDGTEYTAELDSETITNGDGAATYLVTLDDSELVLEAGDVAEVKVYVKFNDQDTNYGSGTTVIASVTGSAIDAEGSEDEVTVTGTFTGKTHTLSVNVPTVTLTSAAITQSGAGDAGASIAKQYEAVFKFNVKAPADDSVYLPLNTFTFGTAGTAGIEYAVTGGATKINAALSSSATKDTNGYVVYADDTEAFTFTVTLEGNNATNIVDISSIWYEISNLVPNGTPEITAGLTDFEASKYLATY